jgi:hypothetical protein
MQEKQPIHRQSVYIPLPLAKIIQQSAKEGDRSFNQEINRMLKKQLQLQEQANKTGK